MKYAEIGILVLVACSIAAQAQSESSNGCAALKSASTNLCTFSQNGEADKLAEWSRMFLVPGMAHCGGGPSLGHFDMLSTLVGWVEMGAPPDSVVATGAAFPGRSRPLCAYPKHAQYTGSGDRQDARNFQCR